MRLFRQDRNEGMMSDNLRDFSERVLELARARTEQAEVFAARHFYVPVSFEANRLKQIDTKESAGVSLRVVANGHVGLSSTGRLDDPSRLVDDALAVAQFGAQAKFELPARTSYSDVTTYDPNVASWPVEAMVDLGRETLERVLSVHPDVLVRLEVSRVTVDVSLMNSRGTECAYRKSEVELGVAGNLIRGTDMLDVYESTSTPRLPLDGASLARRVTDWISLASRNASPSLGQVPVIFTPKGVVGTLFLALQSALNGKTVLQGASPLSRKLGQVAFDPRFSLYDDGLDPEATTSAPCDDEGTLSQRTPLIEAGVVRNFLYDLQTAGLAGARSTGNASRSLNSLPSPTPRAWIVAAGDHSFEAMLREIGRGIVVDQTMGAWSGNVIGGEFSGNVHLGFQVEGGEIVGRVKNTMVSGNVFQALSNLPYIGDRPEWINGSMKVPYLCIQSLGVSSKG
jgi:PmbA protein